MYIVNYRFWFRFFGSEQFGLVRFGSQFGELIISRPAPIKIFGTVRFGESQTVNGYFQLWSFLVRFFGTVQDSPQPALSPSHNSLYQTWIQLIQNGTES